jgi:hypothetical protein
MSDQPTKTAFNKENAPELLGQLVRVLKSQGMDESMDAIKRCGLTRMLNDEWMDDTRGRQKRKRDHRATKKVDPEMLKAWKRHVQKNIRRWSRHDHEDWFDEAISYAEEYWKAMNLDPGDDVPMREIERWAEELASGLVLFAEFSGLKPELEHLRRASDIRVAAMYAAKKNYSLTDFLRAAIDADEAISKAYLEAVSLKSMWDTFEEIPPKQRRMYDDNMKVMNLLRKAGEEAYQTRMTLKRYR